MRYETSFVHVDQFPKLLVDTGFDLVAFLSFLITVIIFCLGTWVTICNSNKNLRGQREIFDKASRLQEVSLEKTLRSQEGVAASNALKASRQAWINDLRDACADYVSAVMNVQRLNNLREGRASYWEGLKDKDVVEHSRLLSEWAVNHIGSLKEVKRLKAKIELLLNPEEIDSKQLMESVCLAEKLCDEAGRSADEPCRLIVENCQVILKQEWEKAKSGK